MSGHNDENSPEQPPSSLRELAQSDTGSSTTSGEDAQSPRQDRARLRWREIKFPGRAAAAESQAATVAGELGAAKAEAAALRKQAAKEQQHLRWDPCCRCCRCCE